MSKWGKRVAATAAAVGTASFLFSLWRRGVGQATANPMLVAGDVAAGTVAGTALVILPWAGWEHQERRDRETVARQNGLLGLTHPPPAPWAAAQQRSVAQLVDPGVAVYTPKDRPLYSVAEPPEDPYYITQRP
jgi:hypothetical protein